MPSWQGRQAFELHGGLPVRIRNGFLILPGGYAGAQRKPENRGYDCNMKTTVTSLDFGTSKIVTLCNPMDHSPWVSSIHGIPQARILEWVSMPFFRVVVRGEFLMFWL